MPEPCPLSPPATSLPRESHARSTVIRLHELVSLDHLSKAFNARGIRPRFHLALLPDHARKAICPLLPRERLHNTLDRALSNKFSMQARVVENGGKVDDRCKGADHSRIAQVLVADDCFADGFSLRDFGVVGLEKVEREVAASEFEGEVRGGVVRGCGADVVQ